MPERSGTNSTNSFQTTDSGYKTQWWTWSHQLQSHSCWQVCSPRLIWVYDSAPEELNDVSPNIMGRGRCLSALLWLLSSVTQLSRVTLSFPRTFCGEVSKFCGLRAIAELQLHQCEAQFLLCWFLVVAQMIASAGTDFRQEDDSLESLGPEVMEFLPGCPWHWAKEQYN